MADTFTLYGTGGADAEVNIRDNARFNTTYSEHGQMTLAFPVVKDKIDVQAWSNKVYYAVQKAVYKLGQKARDDAKRLCPIDTGALKASIYVTAPASQVDQEAGKPYGRAEAPGRASMGYRKAVQKSAEIMGHVDKGEHILSENSPFADLPYGAATLRPTKTLINAGMKRGTTTRTYKGHLGRSLGTRQFENYPMMEETLPFTPMPMSSREQFWVTVGAAAYYAGFVEFGASTGQKAQPFMGPAVRQMERDLPKVIADAMKSVGAKPIKV